MADILQDFPIGVAPAKVYDGISTPAGLNEWWTKAAFQVFQPLPRSFG